MTMLAPQPVETTTQSPLGEAVPATRHAFAPSPLNQRRWQNFKANRRGYWSFWIFLVLFVVSLFANFIANDKPLLVKYDGHLYWPVVASYAETTFGGDFETAADYRDPYLQKQIAAKGGSMIWPPIRYSYDTHNLDLPTPAPSKPTWMLTEAECKDVVQKKGLTGCRDLEYNWLGTDDQGRDVVARLIYGFRISVLFGLTLTILSSIIGIAAGGVQGSLFAFVFSSQQIFTEVFKLGHYFPVAFAACAVGVAIAGFLNSRIVGRIGMRVISHAALTGFAVVAAALFVAVKTDMLSLSLFMALSVLMMFAFGLIMANFTALAMEPQGKIAGTASSLYGTITTLLGIGIGTTIGQDYNGTLLPFATGFLLCTLAALAVVLVTEKGRMFRPHHHPI